MNNIFRLPLYAYILKVFLPITLALVVSNIILGYLPAFQNKNARKREKIRKKFIRKKKLFDKIYADAMTFRKKILSKEYYKFSINDFILLNTCNIYNNNSKLTNFHIKDGNLYCTQYNYETNEQLTCIFYYLGEVEEVFKQYNYNVYPSTTQEIAEYLYVNFKVKKNYKKLIN